MSKISEVTRLSDEKLTELAKTNGVEGSVEDDRDALVEALAPKLTDQEVSTYLSEQNQEEPADSEEDDSDEEEASDDTPAK